MRLNREGLTPRGHLCGASRLIRKIEPFRVEISQAALDAERRQSHVLQHVDLADPTARPPQSYQLDWSPENMERALRLVYRHRSQALHGGTPFPAPMCETPPVNIEWAAPAEVPPGLATRTMGGTWVHTETPMLLHVFAYLVRGALLNWWASLVAGPQSAEETPGS